MSLPDFEGAHVVAAQVRLTKAGDGLSEALRLDPVAYGHHDRVFFIVEAEVSQVNHKPVTPDSDELVRVHTMVCQQMVQVAEEDITDVLASANDRLRRKREEAQGVQRLEGIDEALTGVGAVHDPEFDADLADDDEEPGGGEIVSLHG